MGAAAAGDNEECGKHCNEGGAKCAYPPPESSYIVSSSLLPMIGALQYVTICIIPPNRVLRLARPAMLGLQFATGLALDYNQAVKRLPVKPRLRFAPSPTGRLHVGNLRTALFNYLIAKKHGGKFILRIEDTDRARSKRMYEEEIEAGLAILDLFWDEGPGVGGPHESYFQSQRNDLYENAVQRLLEGGHAYRCFCSPKRIGDLKLKQRKNRRPPRYDRKCLSIPVKEAKERADAGEPHVIRFRLPDCGEVVVHDGLRGDIKVAVSAMEDFIIRKTNGDFTFDLPNVVDDAAMKISLVVRGEEHITNTARHLLLREALDLGDVPYLHLPLILDRNRRKLSKRAGAVTLREFVEMGILPRAMRNALAFLGWHPGGEREIFTLPELLEEFSIERISRSPAIFDPERLLYFHREHLRLTTYDRCKPRFLHHLSGLNAEGVTALKHEDLAKIIFDEIVESGAYFSLASRMFAFLDSRFKPTRAARDWDAHLLAEFAALWEHVPAKRIAGKPQAAKKRVSDFLKLSGEPKARNLLHPLRLALTSEEKGVSIYLVLALLLPKIVAQRIHTALGA